MINSNSGVMSLAALRWCADVGIAVVVLDPLNGELLALNAPAVHDDARLRRAQALAAGTTTELQLARALTSGKVHSQAQTAKAKFGDAALVESLTVMGLEADELTTCSASGSSKPRQPRATSRPSGDPDPIREGGYCRPGAARVARL